MHSDGSAPVDFLAIGTVTRDIPTNDPTCREYRLGGTVSFAAMTAHRLGKRPAIVTRAGDDIDLSVLAEIAELHALPSPATTTFANIYTPQGRIQYVYTPCPPITAADIPPHLRTVPVALLGPLVGEITPDVAAFFPDETLLGAVPQGWMRRWDEDGRVHAKEWENADAFLPHLDALILSIEDIDYDLSRLDPFVAALPLVVLTQYRDGSTVYWRQPDGSLRIVSVPPRPANEVDPTGAGDIFATAFLIRLQETGDPLHAARFANVTASFGVEAPGVEGVPTHEQVMAYLEAHPWDPDP